MALDLYVDTNLGNDGNAGTTPGAGAKATLAGAVAIIPAPMTQPITIHCKGTVADTTTVDLATVDRTATPTNFIKIVVDQVDRHAGVYTTSKYRLELTSDQHAIAGEQNALIIEGLQIKVTRSSSTNDVIRLLRANSGASLTHVSHCIIVGVFTGTASGYNGINIQSATDDVNIWNNIIYGFTGGSNGHTGINAADGLGNITYLYSNTVANCNTAFNSTGNSTIAKNNYAHGTVTYAGTYTTKTTNAASDTDADASVQSIPFNTSTFVNVTATTENLHLAGTGSGLYHVGTNTTGESSPRNFTTDIDGATRPATWDIGADAITSVAFTLTAVGGSYAETGVVATLRPGSTVYLRHRK